MIVELHAIQNFAPANLNRDDTGAPKDCIFGGHRRARISSQCLKRSIRDQFRRDDYFPTDALAVRSKRLASAVARQLDSEGKRGPEAEVVAGILLNVIKDKIYDPKTAKTQYLLFVGKQLIDRYAAIATEHWDALLASADPPPSGTRTSLEPKLQASIRTQLSAAFDDDSAVDLALFGRMIADLPDRNVDAACQVAHAISTNRVAMEVDYFTAVDDLKPDDTEGADMIGGVEFNSSCFYRYANVDVGQLSRNLSGNNQLAMDALIGFTGAFVTSVPSGKQNSFAAQNPPSFVMAVVRDRGTWNLANAFLAPVRAAEESGSDLVAGSVARIERYWSQLSAMYGDATVRQVLVAALEPEALSVLRSNAMPVPRFLEELRQCIATPN